VRFLELNSWLRDCSHCLLFRAHVETSSTGCTLTLPLSVGHDTQLKRQ
jgi:hypothetical protein